jgi:hypothetical protein
MAEVEENGQRWRYSIDVQYVLSLKDFQRVV